MVKVCGKCGEEIREGFFSSADRCCKCGKYLCDDCAKDNGQDIYCEDCFEDE